MLNRGCLFTPAFGLAVAIGVVGPATGQESHRGVDTISVPAGDPDEVGYVSRHALVIGINQYQDPGYSDLSNAVADAQAVSKMLVRRFRFPQENVRLLLDQVATQDAISEALEDWAGNPDQIGEEDLLAVFFAGHGLTRDVKGRDRSGYLIPADGSRRSGRPLWSSLVGMAHLEEVSEYIPAKHVWFILDCCFGGLAIHRAAPPIAAGLANRARQLITAGNAVDQLVQFMKGEASLSEWEVRATGEVFGALLDALYQARAVRGTTDAITRREAFHREDRPEGVGVRPARTLE
jgi:hypothetical protein